MENIKKLMDQEIITQVVDPKELENMSIQDMRDGIFVIASKVQKLGANDPKLEIYRATYGPFFAKWGIKFEDMPDYLPGLKVIAAKYRDSFKSAIVDDHVDALG